MVPEIPKVGQKVRSKISDSVYHIKEGDIGIVLEVYDDRQTNSYIICIWPNSERMGVRDLGWWIYPQRNLASGDPIIHVLSNLEIISEVEDTREYLELLHHTDLAVQSIRGG